MNDVVRLELETDRALGGRWTSLRAGGREWLWTNPHADITDARPHVRPGDAFVDAGGGEECYPCVQKPFDHGVVWSRPWQADGDGEAAEGDGYRLARRIERAGDALEVTYRASAVEPREVLHATHLLLDLSTDARLAPGPHAPLAFWDVRPDAEIEELGGEEGYIEALGDGRRSAMCYTIPDCRTLTVIDGDDELHLELSAADGVPLGFIIWRNLEGWPDDRPYRSLGIEPAMGHDVSLPGVLPGGTVEVGPDASVTWTLRLTARRRRLSAD